MRGATRNRRGTKDTQPPTPSDHHPQFPRDSDATYNNNNNRPSSSSSISRTVPLLTDRASQSAALRNINDYLSTHNSPVHLKPPLPSAKDITETIRFIFHHLHWPATSLKLDEDLPFLLKFLNCPFKLNKSALKAPGTPHAWPSFLSVINWLVETARYNHFVTSSSDNTNTRTGTVTRSFLANNKFMVYALESYSYFIQCQDELGEDLDSKFFQRMEAETANSLEKVNALESELAEVEARIEKMRAAPSKREDLEKQKAMLEDDVRKFHDIVDRCTNGVKEEEKKLAVKENELEVKVEENRRICEENEEIKKRVEEQTVSLRDAERMKRELQAVEREIGEADGARNGWEEKCLDLDAAIRLKFKELESLCIEANQAIQRLKLGKDFRYVLNIKGSVAADVLGIDYKSTLKPELNALAAEKKKSFIEKLEELRSLKQQSHDSDSKLKVKKICLEELQLQIDAVKSQISSVKREIQDFTSRCSLEATKMVEEVDVGRRNLDVMEREAGDYLEVSNAKLQDTIRKSNEEIQMCAMELYALIDSVSQYKEYMEATILEMNRVLSETAATVAYAYKESLTG